MKTRSYGSWLVFGSLVFAAVAMAEVRSDPAKGFTGDLSGVYHCDGGTYKGIAIIRKNGKAYQMLWTIGTETHYGVGLQEGNLLSASWWVSADEAPGIVVYRIEGGGKLSGKYVSYPGGEPGNETMTYQGPTE